MFDAVTSQQPRNPNRIDLGRDPDLRDWTLALAVTEEELRGAVDAVGTCPERVRAYLGLH